MRQHRILSEIARHVEVEGVPGHWLPAGIEAGHAAAALVAGQVALLGTHPGIDLRVRVAGVEGAPAATDEVFHANSDAMYVMGRFGGVAGHGWVDVLGSPLLATNGKPWLFLEFRAVDLATEPGT